MKVNKGSIYKFELKEFTVFIRRPSLPVKIITVLPFHVISLKTLTTLSESSLNLEGSKLVQKSHDRLKISYDWWNLLNS